ncbi:MAG: hypothetical protein L3J75_08095 [Methylococcaceae bacterium]|nr:hypothetical protein [Methylococcaceae bacterium]
MSENNRKFYNIAYGKPDPSSEEGKKFWTTVGILIIGQNDEGEERISMKLNSIPLDAEFDGWFSVFPKDDNRDSNSHQNSNQSINEIAFH